MSTAKVQRKATEAYKQSLDEVLAASFLLQVAVIYVPVLQQAFSTASLSFGDWLRCAAVASSVLWLRELSKIVTSLTVNNQL